jgi:hypothetical protein
LDDRIGCAYKTEDVFNIGDLKTICDKSATCHIETGERILTWRSTLGEKYSDLPGVRKYHDFLVVKGHDGTVVMKVRDNCSCGSWKDSPLRIHDSSVSGVPTETCKNTQTRSLTAEKMTNMITMYDRFIPPHCRPDYLPPQSTAIQFLLHHLDRGGCRILERGFFYYNMRRARGKFSMTTPTFELTTPIFYRAYR